MNTSRLNKVVMDSKMTKVQIAKMCNITRATLDNALNGGDIKVSTLEALANALSVNACIFFDHDNSGINAVNSAVATGSGNAHNNVNIEAPSNTDAAVLTERVKSLEALVAEKERLIKVYEKMIEK